MLREYALRDRVLLRQLVKCNRTDFWFFVSFLRNRAPKVLVFEEFSLLFAHSMPTARDRGFPKNRNSKKLTKRMPDTFSEWSLRDCVLLRLLVTHYRADLWFLAPTLKNRTPKVLVFEKFSLLFGYTSIDWCRQTIGRISRTRALLELDFSKLRQKNKNTVGNV